MTFLQIALLAAVQGLAELLPISSSAHVIVAEKLMGLDPTRPEMTLLLVALHTGTMLAVLVYFWEKWKKDFFQSRSRARAFLKEIIIATVATGTIGIFLLLVIEKIILRNVPHAEVEMLFGNLKLISIALACGGVLILFAAAQEKKNTKDMWGKRESLWIGIVQGFCLPFRGFSRSGATISTGLILGLAKQKAEEFSFALAVVLTPPVLFREIHRLLKSQVMSGDSAANLSPLFIQSFLGMALSFGTGLLALKWLSAWLEKGRWGVFGVYCLVAAMGIWVFLG